MTVFSTTRKGFLSMATSLGVLLAGCSSSEKDETSTSSETSQSTTQTSNREQITDSSNGGHAIAVSAQTASYTAVDVIKTGDDDGNDEADFYGTNAAVYADEGATINLDDVTVRTDGAHANAVFSYGEGTTVNITDSMIETANNNSGAIMVTGGGKLVANNVTAHTTGNSSAPIRSDRGGGIQLVTGGTYTSDGKGSPVIYSTADVQVSDATMESTSSQGVVVEGKNSATLKNCTLTANNVSKNSDKSDWFQAVMIYQSMSGDAAEGAASFLAEGGSITNMNGDIFFVNNTVCTIGLKGVAITNEDAEGNFLRAAAAGWGNEGSNGGQVTIEAEAQHIDGTMLVDEVSNLNLYLTNGSTFVGAINPENTAGEVYVSVDDGSNWELSSDSNIKSLTCGVDGVKLSGYTLTVNGEAYVEGTASTGDPIEVVVHESTGGPGGKPPEKPGGEPPAR